MTSPDALGPVIAAHSKGLMMFIALSKPCADLDSPSVVAYLTSWLVDLDLMTILDSISDKYFLFMAY